MFAKIYALPIRIMILLTVVGTVLWILTGLLRKNRIIKGIQILMFLFITGAILYPTLLGRNTSPERRISPVPFASFKMAQIQPEIYRSLLLNFLMFQAFGLCLAWILPEKWKTWKRVLAVILSGLVFSLIIETLQYFLRLGIAEADDLIFNTLGCVLAAGAMLLRDLLVKYRNKRLKTTEDADRNHKIK